MTDSPDDAFNTADKEWLKQETQTPSEEDVPPEFSEDALALRFTQRHKNDLRYVAAWNRWFHWDGTCWHEDATNYAMECARLICREASAEVLKNKGDRIAERIASAKTIMAVLKLASADPIHAATSEQWDTDLWLLNTPDETIDLKTGASQPHSYANYCTKITAVSPAPVNAPCPLWNKFLHEIMDEDEDLIRYMQRALGYCLTGITHEHVLFFAHGTGRNGKGSLFNTITSIMGKYATVASTEIFMASMFAQHPTGLAALRGARLVTAQETEENHRWAEAKIKMVTGGDPISARFMRQDCFIFVPQFKLVIAANHMPSLQNVDEAIKARLHLIPFAITIPVERRDPKLMEILKAEWPAILRWMIEGCLEWQRHGLNPPNAVKLATNDYLDGEDSIAQWMEECCRRRKDDFELTSKLYQSYKKWAEPKGEHVGKQRWFTQSLHAHKCKKKRQGGTGLYGFSGICLSDDHGMDLENESPVREVP